MHLRGLLLTALLLQEAVSGPLLPELWTRGSSRSLINRGDSVHPCSDPAATEKEGCFTLQDASNNNVRFALVSGATFEASPDKGFFGSVAQCRLESGEIIAVKRFDKATENNEKSAEQSFKLLKELEPNDHIIKVIARGKVLGNPAYAMELAQDGTLRSRYDKGVYKGKENENAFKKDADQLLAALSAMHSKKISHGDVSLDNFIFKGDTLKAIDLDLATKDVDSIPRVFGDSPPEADLGRPISPYATDVWKTTWMFIQMLGQSRSWQLYPHNEQQDIWGEDDAKKRQEKIQKIWPDFTPQFTELLADLICVQEKRLDVDDFRSNLQDVPIYC